MVRRSYSSVDGINVRSRSARGLAPMTYLSWKADVSRGDNSVSLNGVEVMWQKYFSVVVMLVCSLSLPEV